MIAKKFKMPKLVVPNIQKCTKNSKDIFDKELEEYVQLVPKRTSQSSAKASDSTHEDQCAKWDEI